MQRLARIPGCGPARAVTFYPWPVISTKPCAGPTTVHSFESVHRLASLGISVDQNNAYEPSRHIFGSMVIESCVERSFCTRNLS